MAHAESSPCAPRIHLHPRIAAVRYERIDEHDKRLLRKTINYIQSLEQRLQTIGVFARSIANEVKVKGED